MPLNEATIYVFKQGKKDYPRVFGQLTKRDGAFLVGRNFEPNFDWSNLENKEIIMGRPGGMPAMTLEYVLNQNGYTNGENITMNFGVSFNMLAPTFASGTGDYVTLFEPAATQVEKEGNGHIVASIGAAGGEVPYTCFVATQSYIKANKNKLKKFLQCVHDATMYLLSHDNTTIAELLQPYFSGSSVADLAKALANYRANDAWKTTPSMTEADFNRLQDIMTNAGELDGRVQFKDLIDNSIADLITL